MELEQRGITHRDLKPDNILLKEKNNKIDIRICDFGSARQLNDREALMQSIKGTPAYFVRVDLLIIVFIK